MLLNEIPDDCLLAIFDYMNLEDLINCYKVCVKWSYLIAERTKKVKYLIDQRGYSSDAVYIKKSCLTDYTCLSTLFTNLIIVQFSLQLYPKHEGAVEFVSKQESLKGLINPFNVPIEKYCDELEMLSVNNFNPNILRNSSSLKQLETFFYSLDHLKRDAHYLPNLERLKMLVQVPDNPYDGPILEKLKILELNCRHDNIFYGFQLMDSCPNLQSAHITIRANNWFFDETLKHKCLQDLFIQFFGSVHENGNNTWNNLTRLLMKYPNLKHLALRSIWDITYEDIEQLVHILPNLVLLDIRKSNGVLRRDVDYLQDYCKRYGRSIKFYSNANHYENGSDWPQLSIEHETISLGFDFMKHCFFKDHLFLSNFLIPIDY